MSYEGLYVYEPPEIHDDDPIYEAAVKQIEAFRPAITADLIEAVESDPSLLVVRREDAEMVEMHPCCTDVDGKPMCSPSGDIVSGNGECAEFLLSAGDYWLVPVDVQEAENGTL